MNAGRDAVDAGGADDGRRLYRSVCAHQKVVKVLLAFSFDCQKIMRKPNQL
jgi:hypothetical protein